MSLALVLAAMAWLSRLVLKLDAEGKEALRQAAFEENVRLALWRMDSALTGLISLENARPYASYQSLIRALPDAAHAAPTGDLSAAPSARSLLYFQFEPDGRLTWPGAVKTQSARLDQLRRKVTKSALLKSIQYTTDIRTVQKHPLPAVPANNLAMAQADTPAPIPSEPPPVQNEIENQQVANAAPQLQSRANQTVQQSMNINEQNFRQSVINQNVLINAPPNRSSLSPTNPSSKQVAPPAGAPPGSEPQPEATPQPAPAPKSEAPIDLAMVLSEPARAAMPPKTERVTQSAPQDTNLELMHPVWLDEDLFLVRRVSIGKQEYVQGCWLDWPGIRGMLLKLVDDLLPHADLAPLLHPPETGQTQLLASIPAQLIPGPMPEELREGWSILHGSLGIAWLGVLLATLAVAVVLRRTMELNQRRGAFVSAVTHELRTPLTTFRMYTEMLDEGMVPDGEKQKKYFSTLHGEAQRLSHLVENVLAYAQLENNRIGAERIETLRLAELKERILPRLADRAAQSGMELALEMEDGILETAVRADLSAVERILFNLVDNAGKYACDAQDSRILFSIGLKNGMAVLSIRDHGPGISTRLRKKLFAPFSKSAAEAANSAPGVGLGLSISRRLARQMYGDLVLDPAVTDGARFVLTLPIV